MIDKYRVVLIKEGTQWVAVLLEHWIAAQGNEPWDALEALSNVVYAQIELDKKNGIDPPLSKIKPAPAEYFEMAAND